MTDARQAGAGRQRAPTSLNVHSIAIQVPNADLRRRGTPADPTDASVIGVWTTASRQQVGVHDDRRQRSRDAGPFVQVSRLGNPLFNEVIVPMGKKDYWNTQPPADDRQFATYVANPELAQLLPGALPGRVPATWPR